MGKVIAILLQACCRYEEGDQLMERGVYWNADEEGDELLECLLLGAQEKQASDAKPDTLEGAECEKSTRTLQFKQDAEEVWFKPVQPGEGIQMIGCVLCQRTPIVGECTSCKKRCCAGCIETETGQCWSCLGYSGPQELQKSKATEPGPVEMGGQSGPAVERQADLRW